jgi:dipeptidyl aminopeptidase/acylaminoacyl peptidase
MQHPYRVFAALAAFTVMPFAAAQRPMTLVDVLNVPRVSDPQLSPDGRQILFVQSDANWKTNRRSQHIWRINADGTGLMQMTSGADGETSPRWSPDGKTIAFLAKRIDAEFVQIQLLSNAGGEARPLTNHASAVANITWSPDGASLYFRAPDAKSDVRKARERAKEDVIVFDEDFEQQHLWKVNASTKAEARVTSGGYSVINYRLSRDGRKIAMERGTSPLLTDNESNEVWVMDASGANARQITQNHVPELSAELSPDGSEVLFIAQANQNFESYYNAKIFIAPAAGGSSRVLMPDAPYEIEAATWSKDGKSIFFSANMGVHMELFQVDLAGGKPKQLTNGKHALPAWDYSEAADQLVFTATEMTKPGEIFVLPAGGSSPGGPPRQVTHVFDFLTRDYKLPRQESIQWKGADGVTVEGLLYYPLDYREGQRYPLAVQTHGGPAESDKFGFGGGINYVQVLAAKGYAVLQPNYRGSTGYGDAFLRDMVGHYFQNAHLDVLAGVDQVIKMGVADPDRMVKMGWSGGGHMTNKIITFTDRFKAASAGAGASDWVSMYAQSDTRNYRTPWFGGTPWQKDAPISVYWDNSPLKDAWKVKTPTIFLVGEQDKRVPEPQSIEMYRALKSNGVPTHLYVAPREPHGWEELRHVLFKMNAELEWFEKYANKRDYAWEKAPE